MILLGKTLLLQLGAGESHTAAPPDESASITETRELYTLQSQASLLVPLKSLKDETNQ